MNDLGCSATDMDERDGCGQPSLEVSARPFGPPKTRVTLTGAESHQDRRVKLVWSIVPPVAPGSLDTDELIGFEYRQKAGGDYGRWIGARNSDVSDREHDVGGLTNGTTYTFQVQAVNSAGGGLASNERSAVPSTTPGVPTLAATAGDEEVTLTWTPPADDGGRRISSYQCQMRIGAGGYPTHDDVNPPSCADKLLGASATSLTLTDEDDVTVVGSEAVGITNDTTYTFQVRAVNRNGAGDWSKEASARPTDTSGARSYTISATIDGRSWAKVNESPSPTLRATVEVNPRFREQNTTLWVDASGSGVDVDAGAPVEFGPTSSRRDATFTVNPTSFDPDSPYITVALLSDGNSGLETALAVTSVEVRPGETPGPADGVGGDGGRRGSDAVLGQRHGRRRLRVPAEAATGFLRALDGLCGRGVPAARHRDEQ